MTDVNFENRQTDSDVDPLILYRWSPRAFLKHDMDQTHLIRMIDAARWSPSAFNEQPWRFYTSTPVTFQSYLDLLVDANQEWAKNASTLGFLIGKKHFSKNDESNGTFELDCGSAWMAMTLQARKDGWYTHGMAGIKKDDVASHFAIDTEQFEVIMGFAIGKLDEEANDETPTPRKPLAEIWTS